MTKVIIRQRAIVLRQCGKTYPEINRILEANIPKSTLSYWCKQIPFSQKYKQRIQNLNLRSLDRARQLAWAAIKRKRQIYLDTLRRHNIKLERTLEDKRVAKIALAMLFWAEGSKTKKGSVVFGNSDPTMIALFLKLLKVCYPINSVKFRCTLQCRADQNIRKLEHFWSRITQIPLAQFYRARIDARTIGRPSRHKNYKGVCRIDYFSAHVFNDLKIAIEIITGGL